MPFNVVLCRLMWYENRYAYKKDKNEQYVQTEKLVNSLCTFIDNYLKIY